MSRPRPARGQSALTSTSMRKYAWLQSLTGSTNTSFSTTLESTSTALISHWPLTWTIEIFEHGLNKKNFEFGSSSVIGLDVSSAYLGLNQHKLVDKLNHYEFHSYSPDWSSTWMILIRALLWDQLAWIMRMISKSISLTSARSMAQMSIIFDLGLDQHKGLSSTSLTPVCPLTWMHLTPELGTDHREL